MDKKILVAVDGSAYSNNTLHYLARLFGKAANVSFHLFCAVPTSSLPQAKEWLDDLDLMSMLPPHAQKQMAEARRYMENACGHLERAGIDKERITWKVDLSRTAVGQDILAEARRGLYDALVIGRRGLGKLEEWFMGSVSATILEKCHDVPVWIIDGEVDSRKFLVPVDGTPHTLRAVDHLAFILQGNPEAEVTLFHSTAMFAQRLQNTPDFFYETFEPEWCDRHLAGPDAHFTGPEQLLVDSGLPRARIRRLQTSKGMYPSRQIVRQALMDNFGTIVMGRRKSDEVTGLFGSVSERVVAMAVDTAVWIVG